MPFASALARLEDQSILPIGQTELGTMMHTAYDDIYTGPAFDPAEGERLAGLIGDKTVLMMANHGVATVGNSVAEAYDRLYYLERVAQVQLYAMWTGRPLRTCRRRWSRRRCGNSPRRGTTADARVRVALRGAEADARPEGSRLQGLSMPQRDQ